MRWIGQRLRAGGLVVRGLVVRGLVACVLVACGLVVGGCGAEKAQVLPRVEVGQKAWVDALASGDGHAVWTLMGPPARAGFGSEREFARWCKRRCAELLASAVTYSDAELTSRHGELALVLEGGEWRVAAPVMAEAPHVACERLSRGLAMALGEEAIRMLEAVAASGEGACVVTEETALCGTPGGGSVNLTRSGGSWRLDGWISPR